MTPSSQATSSVLKKVRRICLAFPNAYEKKAWQAPTFRVDDRMFAMFVNNHHGDSRVALWCNAPPDAQRLAVADDPENFFVPPYMGPKGWIGVRLDEGLDWKTIAAVLRQAYDGTARRESRRPHRTIEPAYR